MGNLYREALKKHSYSLIVILTILWSFFSVTWSSDMIHGGGMTTMSQMVSAMFEPDLSSLVLSTGMEATVRTVVYAFAGLSVAMVFGLILGLSGSKVLGNTTRLSKIRRQFSRRLLGFMRGIHELVWALLLIASLGLSPIAGVLALGIPYGGMLGRIWADLLDSVDEDLVSALETSGASKLQTFIYVYIPVALPDMLSYTMYRLECGIRSSSVMGFIGLGGLGYQIQLALDDLAYNEVWTYLYLLIIMVTMIDLWSKGLRRRLHHDL